MLDDLHLCASALTVVSAGNVYVPALPPSWPCVSLFLSQLTLTQEAFPVLHILQTQVAMIPSHRVCVNLNAYNTASPYLSVSLVDRVPSSHYDACSWWAPSMLVK